MELKLFEIRDDATFIPAFAILCTSKDPAEWWLLRRAGYGEDQPPCVLLGRLDSGGVEYDPYAWENRTFFGAHLWIESHWEELTSGDVVDARVGLGEQAEPVKSEREQEDPSPYCQYCGAKSESSCKCGPIPENG